MKVILVERLNKSVERLITDCEVFYLCDSKWLKKNRMENNFPIDEEMENELREFTERYAAERALKYIEFKRRTEKEVSNHLKKIPLPQEIIHATIVKMVDYGMLDDELYARDYIEELIEKNQSTYVIKMKSVNKGLKGSLIEAILSELNVLENEGFRALKLIEKRCGKSDEKHDLNKLRQYLYRKGFSAEAIRKSMENHFDGISQ
ncbi:MAG TPA: RecX family transcriptional regulator [Clostridia bacterium]|nr:RecX family transcriptional regulator [Clostridia bacterium]